MARIAVPKCDRCRVPMRVIDKRFNPARPAFEAVTFQCPACKAVKKGFAEAGDDD